MERISPEIRDGRAPDSAKGGGRMPLFGGTALAPSGLSHQGVSQAKPLIDFRSEDGAADQLWNLRNYGVSEGSKSVHPSGNPMSHSTHVGFSCPPAPPSGETCVGSRICCPFAFRSS